MWLNIAIGLFVAILWAITAGFLFGESGTEFNRAFVVMRSLLGTASLACALLLFFGLRTLARMGLRRIGLTNRFVWLETTIGVFIAIFWSVGVRLIVDRGTEFNLAYSAERVLLGAASLAGALLLFFGLRSLARMGLQKAGFTGSGTSATDSND